MEVEITIKVEHQQTDPLYYNRQNQSSMTKSPQ